MIPPTSTPLIDSYRWPNKRQVVFAAGFVISNNSVKAVKSGGGGARNSDFDEFTLSQAANERKKRVGEAERR